METPEALWLNRNDAATLCGLSARQFDDVIRRRAKDAERGTGKTLRFDGPKIIAALVTYRLEKNGPPVDEMDPSFPGAVDSPALERGRLAKAQLLELDLAERQKNLVRSDVLFDAIRPAISVMRETGERLTLKFGNEATAIFNEGVADFEAAALKHLNENGK